MSLEEKHQCMADKLGLPKDHPMAEKTWSAISYFLSVDGSVASINGNTALDLFSTVLARKLKYDHGERDMVAMHHEFGVEHRSGKKVFL
jgi:alpha-aminoadipic semialdehyde synthase